MAGYAAGMTATATPPASVDLHAPVVAGVLAALVGFTATFAIILQGLAAVGADASTAAGALLVLCLVQGALAVGLGLRSRKPITMAWSTPGAALLIGAGTQGADFGIAVAAFALTAVLIVATGLARPLGRAVAAIPMPLANAMLAGILAGICLAPAQAVVRFPLQAIPPILAWLVALRLARRYAVVIALAMLVAVLCLVPPVTGAAAPASLPVLTWPHLVMPHWNTAAVLGLAVPLYLVTMASQNLPGLAVMRANGYEIDPGRSFVATGLGSVVTALFGGIPVNLAALTAALCAGPEAGADASRRWIASVVSGVVYIALGLGAGLAARLLLVAPPLLIEAIAGLALLPALAAALTGAMAEEASRLPALVTLLVVLSGITVAGIGAPLWGLLAGGAVMVVLSAGTRTRTAR